MVALANRRVADLASLPKEAHTTLAVLDKFVLKNVMAEGEDRLSAALIIDHASYVAPRGDRPYAQR